MSTDVCMFTLNDNSKLSKNLLKNKEKQQIQERKKYNDANNDTEEDIQNENKRTYTLSNLVWDHRFCIRCLQNTKCNHATEHALEQDFPLKNMLQNPSRINILNKYLENQDLGFDNQQVRFNICTFIYSNGNCKNCNEGRFKFIDINGEKIKYCYSDLNPKKIRTKLPIGLHIDLVFVENIITKKISITNVLQLQEAEEEELNNHHKNQHNNNQHNNNNNNESDNISGDYSLNRNVNFPDLTNNDNLNFSVISNKYGKNNSCNNDQYNMNNSSNFNKQNNKSDITSTIEYSNEKCEKCAALKIENISLNDEIKALKIENRFLSNNNELSKNKIIDLQKNTSSIRSDIRSNIRSESCPVFSLGKSSSKSQKYYEDDYDNDYLGDDHDVYSGDY